MALFALGSALSAWAYVVLPLGAAWLVFAIGFPLGFFGSGIFSGLAKGLHKVRYYGLWHPARREHAQRARLMLLLDRPPTPSPATRSAETVDRATDRSANHTPSDETRICPRCQQGRLVRASRLYPKQASGP